MSRINCRLLLHPLVRFADPEQALFQAWRTIQSAHAVMRQSAPQRIDKSGRKSFTVGFDHAQIREEVSLGAGLFRGSAMIHFRFALKQRTNVDKDVEDLVSRTVLISSLSAGQSWLHAASRRVHCAGSMSKPSMSWRSSLRLSRQRDRAASSSRRGLWGRRRKRTRACGAIESSLLCGFDLKQRGAGIHLHVRHCHHLRTLPENGATTCVSIFMASSTAKRSPTETMSPGFTADRNDHGRSGRMHHAAVISIDPVRYAIDLDPGIHSLRRRTQCGSAGRRR